MSIASDYNEALRYVKHTCHEERPKGFPEGVRWSYNRWSFDESPYLKATCSTCKTEFTCESADPKVAIFKHCGDNDGSIYPYNNAPKEMLERLMKEQVAKGIRQAPSVFQRITGEVPSLVKAF